MRFSGTALGGAAVAVLVLFSAITGGVASAQTYTIADLGTLPGFENKGTFAHSLNDDGQVVGWVGDETDGGETVGDGLAFLWANGVMTSLGTLGGQISHAFGINNTGQIAGEARLPITENPHAFLYSGGQMSDLGTLGGFSSYAQGINDDGKVAGVSSTLGGRLHAFLYEGGTMKDLGTLPGQTNSQARDINNSGVVVGWSERSSERHHAFIWDDGNGMRDLGTLPGYEDSDTHAYAINANGQVVGLAGNEADGQGRAFLWENGTMTNLGTLGGDYSFAAGINNAGKVVGESTTSTGQLHAFLWQDGGMIDLNGRIGSNAGWALTRATDINSAGQIVGYGTLDGRTRAFLLTPDGGSGDPNDPTDPNTPTGDPNSPGGDPNNPTGGDPNGSGGTGGSGGSGGGGTGGSGGAGDPNDPDGGAGTSNGDPNTTSPASAGCCAPAAPVSVALFLALYWLGHGRTGDRKTRTGTSQ